MAMHHGIGPRHSGHTSLALPGINNRLVCQTMACQWQGMMTLPSWQLSQIKNQLAARPPVAVSGRAGAAAASAGPLQAGRGPASCWQ
jgi:hypothetical protein